MNAPEIKKCVKRFGWWWRQDHPWFILNPNHTTKAKDAFKMKINGGIETLPAKHFWKGGHERAAFAYELARRARRLPGLEPWVKLNWSEQDFLRNTFGESDLIQFTISHCNPPLTTNPPGYSDPLSNIYWNLEARDGALVQEFKKLIQEQREKHGVRKPKGPGARRPLSWLWPEMMDLDDFKITGRDLAIDSGTLSRARKLSQRYEEKFLILLKSTGQIGHPAFGSEPLWKDFDFKMMSAL